MLEMEALLLDLLNHRAVLPDLARDVSHVERNTLLLQKPLQVLNTGLSGRDYLAGDSFSVADLNVASILTWGRIARLDLTAHPDVARSLDACLAQPAYARVRARRS